MTDPTGLRFDRADTEDTTPQPLPAGVEGHPVGTRHPDVITAADVEAKRPPQRWTVTADTVEVES